MNFSVYGVYDIFRDRNFRFFRVKYIFFINSYSFPKSPTFQIFLTTIDL